MDYDAAIRLIAEECVNSATNTLTSMDKEEKNDLGSFFSSLGEGGEPYGDLESIQELANQNITEGVVADLKLMVGTLIAARCPPEPKYWLWLPTSSRAGICLTKAKSLGFQLREEAINYAVKHLNADDDGCLCPIESAKHPDVGYAIGFPFGTGHEHNYLFVNETRCREWRDALGWLKQKFGTAVDDKGRVKIIWEEGDAPEQEVDRKPRTLVTKYHVRVPIPDLPETYRVFEFVSRKQATQWCVDKLGSDSSIGRVTVTTEGRFRDREGVFYNPIKAYGNTWIVVLPKATGDPEPLYQFLPTTVYSGVDRDDAVRWVRDNWGMGTDKDGCFDLIVEQGEYQ